VSRPRVLPLGDAAATIELGEALDPETNGRVRALDHDLARAPFEGFREAVPTLRSLLVLYDPGAIRFPAVERDLLSRAAGEGAPPPAGRRHEIPTLYGGEGGPDLADVARERGLDDAALVALHSSRTYTAYMLGFTPGFAYLGLLPEALASPRRPTPRVRVPAGSVAIAGRQTAVYPVASPGGWRLIGRTSRRLFDPLRAEPALIAPGDHVRFVPVDELAPVEEAVRREPAARTAVVEVLDPGLLTTVQDAGRAGHRRLGVGAAGPLDADAHAAANRALGNPENAAAIECTVAGPALRFLAPVHVAVAGADLEAWLERADLGAWPVPPGAAVLARPGNRLRFAGRRAGCRAYVAFRGGIDVPVVLGSRSTDLQAGFGGLDGRALAAGDELAVLPSAEGRPDRERPPVRLSSSVTVRVVLGPQADHLEPESVARFSSTAWRVGPTSDRVGCRLEGERLRHRGPAEILSDGMVPGSIQVPPDGLPIVMMADGPTTGGYPKIATVVTVDLPLLAQLVPGEGRVRFEVISIEDAQQ
jgi:KipI family sensor histidine kinase inhibitor